MVSGTSLGSKHSFPTANLLLEGDINENIVLITEVTDK